MSKTTISIDRELRDVLTALKRGNDTYTDVIWKVLATAYPQEEVLVEEQNIVEATPQTEDEVQLWQKYVKDVTDLRRVGEHL